MKHAKTILACVILLLAAAMPSMAMAQTPWGNEFQSWLANHPKAGNELQQNPYQIYDPSWRAQHPEVQQYIQQNPTFWKGMRSSGSQYYGESFNSFLNDHPNMAAKLRADPELLYDKNFRERNPGLQAYLETHPNVWGKIKAEQRSQGPGGPGAYKHEEHRAANERGYQEKQQGQKPVEETSEQKHRHHGKPGEPSHY